MRRVTYFKSKNQPFWVPACQCLAKKIVVLIDQSEINMRFRHITCHIIPTFDKLAWIMMTCLTQWSYIGHSEVKGSLSNVVNVNHIHQLCRWVWGWLGKQIIKSSEGIVHPKNLWFIYPHVVPTLSDLQCSQWKSMGSKITLYMETKYLYSRTKESSFGTTWV